MAVILTSSNWDYDYSHRMDTASTAAVAVIMAVSMAVALIVMMTKAVTHLF